MQTVMVRQLGVLLLLCCASVAVVADAAVLPQLNFFHRFSNEVVDRLGGGLPRWTPDYHKFLARQDAARHGRLLATADGGLVTFIDGNITGVFLGRIQYAVVEVGTPPVPYFVGLDTGSNLFWLPCQCSACANPGSNQIPSTPYDPTNSTTSRAVTCGSTTCSSEFSQCAVNGVGSTGQCEYIVSYGFGGNSSTIGTVYEDVMQFIPETGTNTVLTPSIVLGCGRVQTGDLLQSAYDGLLGLGRSSFTVPTILSSLGIVGSSFSMCFDFDGSGRIVFGDSGGPNVSTTPFQPSPPGALRYLALVDSITVGETTTVPVGQSMNVDTGTSFTYLPSTAYNAFLTEFGNLVTYKRTTFPDGTFDLCYATTNTSVQVPSVVFNMAGNTTVQIFGLLVPYGSTATGNLVGFCVGVLNGGTTGIFGANFMAGYNVIFNSHDEVIGFDEGSCYDTTTSAVALSPGASLGPSPSPSPSLGPSPTPTPTSTPGKSPTPARSAPPPSQGGPPTSTPIAGSTSTGSPTGPASAPSSAPGLHSSILSLIASSVLATFMLSNLGF